jgi:hypothetical protein
MAKSSFPNITARPHRDLGASKAQCNCCKLYFPAIELNSNSKCDECDIKEQAAMSNIKIEMNHYPYIKQYVAMVLYTNASGESASICYYPNGKREAAKLLKALEMQYKVKGSING